MMNIIKVNFILQFLLTNLPTRYIVVILSSISGQANVSSSSKDEEKGKESEKKDNEADEKGRFIC